MTDAALRFVIETPKPLSMDRILMYLVELEKLYGVPARLIRIEQIIKDDDLAKGRK